MTRTWYQECERRMGRRGVFLTLLALIDAGYGSALIAADRGHPVWWPASVARADHHHHLAGLPLATWGWIWIITAVFLLTGVLSYQDRVQYAAGSLIPVAWGILAADWWLRTREPGGWGVMCIYLGAAAAILLISGWPEIREPP
jgi:hypothetical protein